jgi:phage gp46-like protein
MPRDISHRAAFESLGETRVRVLSAKGGDIGAQASAWLAEQDAKRAADSAAKRETREEQTLSISQEANSIAREALSSSRRANNIAIIAAIIATIAMISNVIMTIW